jgi:hypothetical protein
MHSAQEKNVHTSCFSKTRAEHDTIIKRQLPQLSVMMFVIFILFSLGRSAVPTSPPPTFSPLPCNLGTDPCATGCPCAIFETQLIQTNKVNNNWVTTLSFNVTNLCDANVFYVEYVVSIFLSVLMVRFAVNTATNATVLNVTVPATYQGTNYQWTTSVGPPDSLISGQPTKYLRFTPSSGPWVNNGPPATNFGMRIGMLASSIVLVRCCRYCSLCSFGFLVWFSRLIVLVTFDVVYCFFSFLFLFTSDFVWIVCLVVF